MILLKGGGSYDLDVCGLHGDHVVVVISSRGESIAGWGFTLYTGTSEGCLPLYIIKGCHGRDHVTWMCMVSMQIM